MFPEALLRDAEGVIAAYRRAGLTVVTAESCTGGLIIACLTEIAGSSDVVDRGFITYSNAAKMEMLDVAEETLERLGAVSEEVARAMAEGALKRTGVDLTVAVTGIAGPGGGSAEKPVGLVHLACARRGAATLHERQLFGDIGRGPIRDKTVAAALAMLAARLED